MKIEIGRKPKYHGKPYWGKYHIKTSSMHFACLYLLFFFVQIDFSPSKTKEREEK